MTFPPVSAVSASYGVLEALREALVTYKADEQVIAIVSAAIEQLEKLSPAQQAKAWVL